MAQWPSLPPCAHWTRWGTGLFVLSILLTVFGCSQEQDAPAVATAERTDAAVEAQADAMQLERDADGNVISVRVGVVNSSAEGKPEGANKFVDDVARKSTGSMPAKSRPGTDGYTSDVRFLSRRLLAGTKQSSPLGAFGGGFGGNNVGNLFQGGAGALGFGGGNVGMFGNLGGQFGFQGGRQAGDTPDMSAEHYQHFEDNPFKVVRGEDALSTISTAVDTAAYANARARISEGQLPTKDAVRIADFVNYFPYGYAAPRNGDPVAFKLELAYCPWQPAHHLLRVGLKARVIDKDQMPARNLVFLIDTSGSMNGPNRLPLVQESLKLLVEQLTGRDRVSIVTYAGIAGLSLPPTPGNHKDRIKEEINNLSAGGSTNGEGGIKMAYEQAERTFIKDGINRVILATDGDFNVGVADDAQLVRLIEGKRK
ncbi:MAG TPA: von Willebrand factor type A domain-containing protein, partial [Gemmataceae bacterium]|nr:von Willebrand factor type A domain-containing protein [Gemmataceae bacterium]